MMSEAITTTTITIIVGSPDSSLWVGAMEGVSVGSKVGTMVGGVGAEVSADGAMDGFGVGTSEGREESVGIPVGGELGAGEVVGYGVSEKNRETKLVSVTGIPRSFKSAVTRVVLVFMKASNRVGYVDTLIVFDS